MKIKEGSIVKSFLKEQGLLAALFLVLLFFTLWNRTFLSSRNILLVLRQVTLVGIMACGMTLVIVGGNFDLSVGSLMSLTAVISVRMHNVGGPLLSVGVTLLVGLAVGLLNGYLCGYLKLNSMIVTLGMLSVLQALTLIYTNGQFQSLKDTGTWFSFLGGGYLFGIPFQLIIYIVVLLLFHILLTKTVFGRQLQAVGFNRVASQFSGINDNKLVLLSFVTTGLTAALAGIIVSSRVLGSQNTTGMGYEFNVIATVILGGANLNGGEGNICKTMIGVLILGFLQNGFIMIGLPYYFQYIAQCVIIIGIVWLDIASKRREVLRV